MSLWGNLAVRLALSPVLVAQGLAVRRRARRLPEAAGPREGVAGQGPVLRLLIAGDSSAAGVGVAHQDQALAGQVVARLAQEYCVYWQLHATSGHTTADTLARLEALPAQGFDLALTALGVNHATRLHSPARFAEEQERLRALLRQKFGVRFHLRSGLPPMGRFALLPQPLRAVMGGVAGALDAVLAEDPATHLPFDPVQLDPAQMAEDGFHPGAAIYAAWAQAAAFRLAPAARQISA